MNKFTPDMKDVPLNRFKTQNQPRVEIGDSFRSPIFDRSVPRNLTVQLGGTAYLPCRIHDLGNKSVKNTTLYSIGYHDRRYSWRYWIGKVYL